MVTAYVIVLGSTIVVNAGIALADLVRAKVVVLNATAVGVSTKWLPALGWLKAAGAAGLLLGLLGLPLVGIAAALGLVLFFAGAIVVHIRARVLRSIGVPGAFMALALACLVLQLAR